MHIIDEQIVLFIQWAYILHQKETIDVCIHYYC